MGAWQPRACRQFRGAKGVGVGQCEVGPGKEGPALEEPGFLLVTGATVVEGLGQVPGPAHTPALSLDTGLPLFVDECNGIQHRPPDGCWMPRALWFCGESSRVAARGRPQATVGS